MSVERLVSTTQDRVLLDAIAFLLAHKGVHNKWLAISHATLSEDDLPLKSWQMWGKSFKTTCTRKTAFRLHA